MTRYVALLRGINVGGNNLIKMTALKACVEALGFEDVVTYIASGNVLFASREAGSAKLTARIEKALAAAFAYRASVFLRSERELRRVVEGAPPGFGSEPATYRYDVIFLKSPLTAAVAIKGVPANPAVDQTYAGPGVLYSSRLIRKATQSRIGKLISMPIYQSMTIRNWNTTTALLRMLSEKVA